MIKAVKHLFGAVILILLISACRGSGGSGDAAPPDDAHTPVPTPPVLAPDTSADPALPAPGSTEYPAARDAARFLMQATFGPTAKEIDALMGVGYEAWIDEQMALPQIRHLPLFEARLEEIGLEVDPAVEDAEEAYLRDLQRSDIWWESAIWGGDQLRQRVAWALSQILVISNVSDALFNDSRGIAHYHDILAEHAFGNYRDLLEAVTLNPMMGQYLSMVRNEKADPSRNIRPDENYAREIMQLFSIGLVELNQDGSVKLDGGEPIPTYGQDDVKELARVFTGWNQATINVWWQWPTNSAHEVLPMKAFPEYHDHGEKTLFGDRIIPAGLMPAEDIDRALDILFAHANVAPFISKQLIQRLVTSNPSSAYVERVASVFNDNGAGAKGDLGAVVKAILLDDEARNGHVTNPGTFGKIKEPVLKVSALWRAFKAQGVNVREADGSLSRNRLRYRGTDRIYGQRPYGSFSVFNFYRPEYSHPGQIKETGLLAPEFQIHTESQLMTATNGIGESVFYRDAQQPSAQWEQAMNIWDMYPPRLYISEEKALAGEPQQLLDRINLLLMAGQMSQAMYDEILLYLNMQPTASDFDREMMVYDAIYLVAVSPQFAVQR